jgi:hypothetical protein
MGIGNFAVIAAVCVIGGASLGSDRVKLPKDHEYSRPTAEDVKKVDQCLLELDVFYHRQDAWMVCARGTNFSNNRASGEGDLFDVDFVAAENKQGTRRERIEVSNLDPTPREESFLNGNMIVPGGGPVHRMDHIATKSGKWFVDELSGREEPTPVEEGKDSHEVFWEQYGAFDPIGCILQVAPKARFSGSPSQVFPSKRFRDVVEVDGLLIGRWVTPMPRTNNKVFFRSTVAFKDGFPTLVLNELGKGSEEEFSPLYPLGSVEIIWKKVSEENTVPIRVIRRVEMNPKDRKSDVVDRHFDFRLNWYFGNEVPKELFDKQSLGSLSLTERWPSE